MTIHIHRRDFLKGCCVASLTGSASRSYAVIDSIQSATTDTLVVVFLRGAMDALSLVSPGQNHPDRANYEANRDQTRVPYSGTGAGLPIGATNWQFHPRASLLNSLYSQGHLAIVLGAGQMQPTPVVRSHFEAQANLESGLGGGAGGIGWLTRCLVSANLPANVPVPAVSMGSITATSLLGSTEAITMNSGQDFRLDQGNWPWNSSDDYGASPVAGLNGIVQVLPSLWQNSTLPLASAGLSTLDALALFRSIDFNLYDSTNHPNGYQPSGGANYAPSPNTIGSTFGAQLRNIAQLIKRGVGLRIATVDLGGWDTHNGQGSPANGYDYFGNQVQGLSEALNAFYTDLSTDAAGNYMQNVSIVTVSEFGRRVLENASGGTDHGYGTIMLALGASVNGGKIYGTFPGLGNDQLFEGADVDVTTDYRQVLAEALIARLGNPNIGYVFPGYSGYAPLGIFQQSTTADTVFRSGFE